MTQIKRVPLAEVLGTAPVFVDGDWIESKDQNPEGDVRLIQLADIGIGSFINKSRRFLTGNTARRLGCTFLESGDVLIARMPDPIGRACVFPGIGQPAVTAVDVCIVRVNPEVIDSRYLVHFLNSTDALRQVSSKASGSTRQRISRSNLGTISIPFPPLDEQRRIAVILDKINQIHRKISNSSKLEDEFNASAFNAIFGDPTTNPKGFPETRLADLCERPDHIKCGPFGTQLKQHEFRGSGVPLWGIKHVNRQFQLSTNEFLEEETAHRLSNYSIQPGDIVMTRKGTIGNCSVYPENFSSGIMHSDLLRIRLDKTKCLPDFAAYQLHHSPAIKRQIQIISGGAVMAGINVGKLKEIKIVVPHIDIQRKFTSLLDTASQKSWAQKQIAIKYALELIASLESQVFSGMQRTEER